MISNRVLILDFDKITKIGTCFNRESRKIVKIFWESDLEPHPGQFIKYGNEVEIENGVVILNLNQSNGEIEDANGTDFVRISSGKIKIGAWIGFSDNPLHRTYDRKLAFCDWYGLLDNSKHQKAAIVLGVESGKRMFSGHIVVNDLDYLENGTQLFKVDRIKYEISEPERQNEVEESLRKLDDFEEKLASEQNLWKPKLQRISTIGIVMEAHTDLTVWMCDQNMMTVLAKNGSRANLAILRLAYKCVSLNNTAVAVLKRNLNDSKAVSLGTVFNCTVEGKKGGLEVVTVGKVLMNALPFETRFNRVLVLEYDDSTKVVTCFDKELKSLVKVLWGIDEKPTTGKFIVYSKNTKIEDGLVIASDDTNIELENATKKDCVRISEGGVRFGAWIGFSDNPSHRTYDRKLAFCDWYGLLDNSLHQQIAISLGQKSGRRMFRGFIVVNDLNYVENGTQLFRVHKIEGIIDQFDKQAAVEESLRRLYEFENNLNGNYTLLFILDYNDITSVATCVDKKLNKIVKMRWESEEKPSPGQLFKFWSETENTSEIQIASSSNTELKNTQYKEGISVRDGKFYIRTWITFSKNPDFKTYDRSLAISWYGLVDNSQFQQEAIQLEEASGNRLFQATIEINDIDFLENNTQLFKVCHLNPPIENQSGNREKLDAFEEALATGKKLPFEVADSALKLRVRGRKKGSAQSCETASPSNPETSVEESRNIETLSTSEPSNPNQPPPCHLYTMGVAMTSTSDGDLVIWMCDLKAIAMLRRTCLGFESIQLGSAFESIVQKQKKETVFEVTVIRKVLEAPVPFQIHQNSEDDLEAEFVVDLCTPNFDFNFWTIFTGIAVLNTEGIGMVTTADTIITPTGERKKLYQVMRTYQGDPRASRMVGMCRLEEQRVPRRVVDGNYQGFETVLQFHWKLYELKGSVHFLRSS